MLWWLAAAALELASISSECKIFWAMAAWPGIIAVPTFWTIFLWRYVHSVREVPSRSARLLLVAAPLVGGAIALSNPWHGLVYGPATGPADGTPGAAIIYDHGPLFYAMALYLYPFMLYGLATVARSAFGGSRVHRSHARVFVLVTSAPLVANIGYVAFGWTIFGFDPTPFSFAVTLGAISWLIVGVRLFDVVPVAHRLLLEVLPDPVLVIDSRERIIECNPAALALAGGVGGGHAPHLEELPRIGPALAGLLREDRHRQAGHLVALGIPERYFEVKVRPIAGGAEPRALDLGRMIYLRDVTHLHRSTLELSDALATSEDRLRTILGLHDQLQQQARRDPLTGLFNRRHLDFYIERVTGDAGSGDRPLTVAMIDLDQFKALNDRHGHVVGDDVLKGFAARLETHLAEGDAAFRLGGEEFLVVMPGSDSLSARERVERLRRQMETIPLDTRIGPLPIAFSAGIASLPSSSCQLDELLQRADESLYEAKRSGRNRVIAAANGDEPAGHAIAKASER